MSLQGQEGSGVAVAVQLQLGSDPWPGTSICYGLAKKGKKRKRNSSQQSDVPRTITVLISDKKQGPGD